MSKRTHEDRLQEICHVAAALFFERGYSQTTTKMIAETCGISVGTLYYYITSKSDFLTIFSEIHTDDINKWEKEIHRRVHDSSPEEILRKAVWKLVHLIDKRWEMVLLWYGTEKSMNAEQMKTMWRVQKRIVALFKEIIELGCQQGEFETSEPLANAVNIYMLCNTWALQHWQLGDFYTVNQYARLCQDTATSIVHGSSGRAAT